MNAPESFEIRRWRRDGTGVLIHMDTLRACSDEIEACWRRREVADATDEYGEPVGRSFKNDDGRWTWWAAS